MMFRTHCWQPTYAMKVSQGNMPPRTGLSHDDVIKWKHFLRYWPAVRGIPRSPVNSPHKGWWRRALMFSSIFAWMNGWINTREAGDLRRHLAHYGITVMALSNNLSHLHDNALSVVVLIFGNTRQIYYYVLHKTMRVIINTCPYFILPCER